MISRCGRPSIFALLRWLDSSHLYRLDNRTMRLSVVRIYLRGVKLSKRENRQTNTGKQ